MNVGAPQFKEAMRKFATGVTVVTTIVEGRPHGFTANAFASVAADPPSVLICVNRHARSHGLISAAGIFCVNVLTAEQHALASHFAHSGDDAQFDGIAWQSDGGAPVLPQSLAWFDCTLAEEHSVATHTIFVGAVRACAHADADPLGYFGGQFHDFGLKPIS